MERKRILVALVASVALTVWIAEFSSAQAPPPPNGHSGPGGPPSRGGGGRFVRPARERWHQMSPEDRQRFRSNAERWLSMPPEEQRALHYREGLQRQRIRREAEAAIQQSGLQLEAEKRELYERRYLQERRRIERSLRQELDEKRQRELAPVMENLKKEFGDQPKAGSPAATAAPSSAPPSKQR